MNNAIQIEASGNVVEIQVTGKLTAEMYDELVPLVDRLVKESGKLRMLFTMHDFHGWTAGALWDDIKFGLDHFRDISRLAIVGETKWQKGMAVFCKPFTTAKVKYFESTDLEAARAWVREPAKESAK